MTNIPEFKPLGLICKNDHLHDKHFDPTSLHSEGYARAVVSAVERLADRVQKTIGFLEYSGPFPPSISVVHGMYVSQWALMVESAIHAH